MSTIKKERFLLKDRNPLNNRIVEIIKKIKTVLFDRTGFAKDLDVRDRNSLGLL
ncbi:hypothetical protein [Ekhidna sp.]|uniref:hypothetical protein n=1 Tax=Ekhidna sp. TaxID=2608089 RepID=UPI003298CF3D